MVFIVIAVLAIIAVVAYVLLILSSNTEIAERIKKQWEDLANSRYGD